MKGPARLTAPQRNPGTSTGTFTICARISDPSVRTHMSVVSAGTHLELQELAPSSQATERGLQNSLCIADLNGRPFGAFVF